MGIRMPLVHMLREQRRRFPEGIARTNRGGAWHSPDLSSEELRQAIDASARADWPTKHLTPIRGWFMYFPRGAVTTKHTHPEADVVTVDGVVGTGVIGLGDGSVVLEEGGRVGFSGSDPHCALPSRFLWAVLVVNWRKKS